MYHTKERDNNNWINALIALLITASFIFNGFSITAMAARSGKHLIEEITENTYYSSRIVYRYDKSGQLSEKTVYRDNKVESTTEYHYYPNGALFEELYKGVINLYWHYDSKGTVIERDETGGVGSPACCNPRMGDTVHTEYDSSGRLSCFQIKSGETGKTNTLTYEYDSQGRILRFCVGDLRTDSYDYRPDGSFIRTRDDKSMKLFITEYYNAEGLRTQVERRQGSDLSTNYYEYDVSGNLIRQFDSRYGSERSWKYDEHGNPLEEWINGEMTCSYRYSYDSDGYLVKSVRTSGDTSLKTTYRYE